MGAFCGNGAYGDCICIKNIGENMTRGLFKRRKPIQERLEKLYWVILRDASNRKKSAKEMANNYGVSYGALLIYFKENRIKKLRKIYYTRVKLGRKTEMEDLRDYIKKNNITKRQIQSAVLSICEDAHDEKVRRMI